jgi:hypothetical protein
VSGTEASAYTALYGPDHARVTPGPVETELWLATDFLGEIATANVHDHAAMIKAASGLHYRLSALTAAVKAERGGER